MKPYHTGKTWENLRKPGKTWDLGRFGSNLTWKMAKKIENLGFGVKKNLGNGQNNLGKPGKTWD